jgi:CHAT domain-containing protein/tetratricopeptide (TPR) repeat protein
VVGWVRRGLGSAILAAAMLCAAQDGRAQTVEEIAAWDGQVIALYRQGKYAQAIPFAEQALAGSERLYGAEHPHSIVRVLNLARAYSGGGRHREAGPLFERALAVREKTLGKDHPDTLDAANALGMQYRQQARLAEAEALLKRTLAARQRVLGKEHPNTLASMVNLADILRDQGHYPEAAALTESALAAFERARGKDHDDTLTALNNLAAIYFRQGRYAEAEQHFRRVFETRERLSGPTYPGTLTALNNLAAAYRAQARYADAEALLHRSLAARERTLGNDHPDTLNSLNDLAVAHDGRGDHTRAEALYRRVLETRERVLGPEHPDTLTSVNNLAHAYSVQGREPEAEALYRRALEAKERTLGRDHPDTLSSLGNLASSLSDQGRYGEAEQLYRRALDAQERTLGKDHPGTITSINGLAVLYRIQGRDAEAEPLYRRALEAAERTLGAGHPITIATLGNLADLYRVQERPQEAEPLLKRVVEAHDRLFGDAHPGGLAAIGNLARLYHDQGRHPEAEALLLRALAIAERAFGKDHRDTLTAMADLADVYAAQGRQQEAEPMMRRVIDARGRIQGPEHPHTLTAVNALALFYRRLGRHDEAEALYRRVADIADRVFGKTDPRAGLAFSNLGELRFARGDWAGATAFWRRAAEAMQQRIRYGIEASGRALTGRKQRAADGMGVHFAALVKAASRIAPEGKVSSAGLDREMFQAAQWALDSDAAQSLAQMAARGASGNPAVAALVRERQDLLSEWQAQDRQRNAAMAQSPAERDANAEAALVKRLSGTEARLAEIDKRLAANFPDYAAMATATPLSADDVQAQLRPDEVLVMILDTQELAGAPAEIFIWAVTKTGMRWRRAELGGEALTREVQALRCGLDAEAWTGQRCRDLTGQRYSRVDQAAGRQPPFDLARAHRLYQALFGEMEDLLKDRHLLLVPSGALTQLPVQALVTAAPHSADYRTVSWLARSHAVTVMPAVSSLKALRRTGAPSAAKEPFIGFGNPLLDGADTSYAPDAKLARDRQRCRETVLERVARAIGWTRGAASMTEPDKLADVAAIRRLSPLPETADELCAVARDLRADPGQVYLGSRATEAGLKALSLKGVLARHRVVHFATHGAVAGELRGRTEPGLILTPPAEASAEDDGYLSASEIAGLKLDADWVILSACNTAAAGEAANAEALSGLARAFIYAQARALLVSHWAVDSHATVALITEAVRAMAADRAIGRAEAFRRSMLALLDKGEPRMAHPAYWAPFVVVGEGAR